MLTHPPVVCLLACKTCAVYAGLLACADTDCLTVFYVANRVGLCVFKCNHCNCKVTFCSICKFFVFCYDVAKVFFVNFKFVSALFKCDAVNILCFYRRRNIVFINFDYVVCTFAFAFEDFQSFVCVAWCDNAVGNFFSDNFCCCSIANIAESDKVTEGRHSVRTACSCISAGKRRKFKAFYKVDFFECICKRFCYSCASWANVFEACCCRKTCCCFKFFYKLPAVESIHKVDVAWAAVENFDWKFALFHKDTGWFLVRVTAVFKFKFCHFQRLL